MIKKSFPIQDFAINGTVIKLMLQLSPALKNTGRESSTLGKHSAVVLICSRNCPPNAKTKRAKQTKLHLH
jgi:hypothetical protein